MTSRSMVFCPLLVGLLAAGCRCDERRGPAPTVTETPAASVPQSRTLIDELGRRRRAKGVRYVPPTPDEERSFSEWILAVTRAAIEERLPESAAPPGFRGTLLDEGRLWVIGETPDRKRGAGALVLRPSARRSVVVEAPHTFFDRRTLEISTHAFQALGARALLINTLHRGLGVEDDDRAEAIRKGASPSDVAHAERSFFDAAHRALLEADRGLVVLQVHGFGDDHAPGVDAIVSAAGTRGPASTVADALGTVLGQERVKAYPEDIKILGGNSNTQAISCRAGKIPFIHLELSASLRNRLTEDAPFGERFARALGEGLRRE